MGFRGKILRVEMVESLALRRLLLENLSHFERGRTERCQARMFAAG